MIDISCMKPGAILIALFLTLATLASAQDTAGIVTLGSDTIHCPEIMQGDTVVAVFYIRNAGADPIKIYQVHPGCQCTTPEFHDTLFPGQTDSIVLVFYSKNHHEPHFLKDALVLNNVQEKAYFVEGTMKAKPESGVVRNRKIRLTNLKTKTRINIKQQP